MLLFTVVVVHTLRLDFTIIEAFARYLLIRTPIPPQRLANNDQVAFDRGVRAKTVTLEGDSFEPQGTLTGGSKSQLGVILGRLAELQSASRELGVHQERLRVVSDKIGRLSAASKKVRFSGMFRGMLILAHTIIEMQVLRTQEMVTQ